ncbi:MAG: glycosyltransferase family 2 protein [[Clostridium] aminophilum]|uniref:glycosyltransferase family 2 protein n=1 Tax=[Clostridium] aminophilum TaxID=1526 RepID=UPI0026F2D980|nr:glycosyltransferase family 2 protein [[Clostridium] aminophilum]MDD6196691.1 glycosyltransferase family 2 protein [[Clostridium] aminophilum]
MSTDKMTIDAVIPTYRPDDTFYELIRRLLAQKCPLHRIIVMNTGEEFWDEERIAKVLDDAGVSEAMLEVHHLRPEDFDHGATRSAGIRYSSADAVLCMTHDAIPADRDLTENLLRALTQEPDIAAAYGRQLPAKDCRVIERFTRSFNYPEESRIKSEKDLPELGIKTYFCSNVCAVYRRNIWEKLGGFTKKTIFNEDMIYAAGAVKAGYRIAYAADARVIHSHNYTCMQQLHRNFDLGVSQADHPEVFDGVPSEGEGVKMVKKTASWLIRNGHAGLLPELVLQSGFKYLGYRLGKAYRALPEKAVLALTMNRNYWKE